MRFEQSSPVQPVTDFRGGGTVSITDEQTNKQKSSCLILDCLLLYMRAGQVYRAYTTNVKLAWDLPLLQV